MNQPTNHKSFLITVDTEGDNQWVRQEHTTTKNAEYLPRFQALCEKYDLKPTYLTNWEMAHSPAFIEFGKDVLSRDAAEIGMHLHPWDMPPSYQLTYDDLATKPYLIEYPDHIMREKINIMTDCLEETFQGKMRSHRAGRWSFDTRYAAFLIERGYLVDCSVSPNFSWENCLGDPQQKGGTDYTNFPETSYFMDSADIAIPGNSPLLEVPMTIVRSRNPLVGKMLQFFLVHNLAKQIHNRLNPALWFRPTVGNLQQMVKIVDHASAQQKDFIEFMIHSSELMPGGSPTTPDYNSVEKLYCDLEKIFNYASASYKGKTLHSYYQSLLTPA